MTKTEYFSAHVFVVRTFRNEDSITACREEKRRIEKGRLTPRTLSTDCGAGLVPTADAPHLVTLSYVTPSVAVERKISECDDRRCVFFHWLPLTN